MERTKWYVVALLIGSMSIVSTAQASQTFDNNFDMNGNYTQYLYATSNAQVYVEGYWSGGPTLYWALSQPGWASITYKYQLTFPIASATTYANIDAITWFDPTAQAYLDVSADGINWKTIESGTNSSPHTPIDISSILQGSETAYVRARLYAGETDIGAQFLRTTGSLLGPTNNEAPYVYDFEASSVPEPATVAFVALGLCGLALIRRRKTCLVVLSCLAFASTTQAADIYVSNYSNGTIGEYTTNGVTINASLITGLSGPFGMAVSGGYLYVANQLNGTICKYTSNGTLVNPSLVNGMYWPLDMALSGGNIYCTDQATDVVSEYTTAGVTVNSSLLSGWCGIAVSNGYLYVCNPFNGTIGKYTTNGALVNASLVTGLGWANTLTVDGNDLFVTDGTANAIGEYTINGAVVNAALVGGLVGPNGIAAYGGNLYVVNGHGNTIGEYDETTGATVNASLISGLDEPTGIAIDTPEPATVTLVAVGLRGNLRGKTYGNKPYRRPARKPAAVA